MAYVGNYKVQSNKIIQWGLSDVTITPVVETAANCYPGRLVTGGTAEGQIIVNTNLTVPIGWLGWELTDPKFKLDDSITTGYAVGDEPAVHSGYGVGIRAAVAAYGYGACNDPVINWTAGTVMPVAGGGDGWAILKFAYSNSAAAAVDTGIDVPAGYLIEDAWVRTATHNASGTINVGFINAVEGGDEDGLIAALAIAAATTTYYPNYTWTAGTTEYYVAAVFRGALLGGVGATGGSSLGANVATDYGAYFPKSYVTDGTITSLSYTTSNHTQTGTVYIMVRNANIRVVGRLKETVTSSSSIQNALVQSLI